MRCCEGVCVDKGWRFGSLVGGDVGLFILCFARSFGIMKITYEMNNANTVHILHT